MIRSIRSLMGALKSLPHFYEVDKSTMAWGMAAVVLIPTCVALSQFLIGESIANGAALSASSQANKTLKADLANAKTLKSNVDKLLADESLAALRAGEGDNNFRVVLDALPVTGDAAGFAASLQNVILKRSGVMINKLSAKDAVTTKRATTTPQTVRFDVEVTGDSNVIKVALTDIEKSIRPVEVTTLSIVENGPKTTAHIAGVTYYFPEKAITLKTEEVKRP